jgi:hypothetical protein
MSLQPITVLGFDNQGGLQKSNKPFLNPDTAFDRLENAYTWRNQVKKREGIRLLGRLERLLTGVSLGTTPAGPPNTVTIANIFTTLGITGENPTLEPGTLVITVGAPDTATFTDQGDGTFVVTGAGVAAGSFVNYTTGQVVLQFTTLTGGAAITANLGYHPGLPVMGIPLREIAAINDEQTIWFDTKYAYIWNGSSFQEFIPGTTWSGTDSDFFWSTNYRGVNPQDRLFFTTNFVNTAGNPIRYTDGNTWTDFSPVVAGNAAANVAIGSVETNGTTFNGVIPNAPIIPGSVMITVAGITFTDPTGSGTLTGNPGTNSGTINYTTGVVVLNFNPTILFTGSITNITTAANATVTSANHHLTTGAQLTITGVTGTIGPEVNNKTFTITFVDANNFQINATTTGVYTAGGDWTLTDQATTVMVSYQSASTFLFQARILIPYFGRLLALNVWEGNTVGGAVNIFNRCRFSQVGSPVQSDAWRSDVFGKGGFLDAPTNEQIISATFLNNTLIVFFERTTWQLRYVGEYGLPFIWERIASDLGSESTFSPVLFNANILAVGDRALIAATSNIVDRIDLSIPDQIFYFQNTNNGVKRVHGIRNYQKELVYWCYADSTTQAGPSTDTIYPNRVLLYNYRNNTWAVFRDNVTAFGTFQSSMDVTWDSQTVFWDDESTTWDDFDTQTRFPLIVSGNQEGYVHYYQYTGPQGFGIIPIDEQPSLYISGVTFSSSLLSLTIPNHNLATNELIFITGLMFADNTTHLPVATDLNDLIYRVTVTDPNTVVLAKWDFATDAYYTNFPFTPSLTTNTYIGGGQAAILQNIAVQTKDFNPFQQAGSQAKLSYVDFLMDVPDLRDPGFITGATRANPCVITSPSHGLYTGQMVTIRGVQGMTQLNTSAYYRIIVIDANSFSIGIDSTSFGIYTAGGRWILLSAGMSVQIFLNSSPGIFGNLVVGNRELKTTQTPPFYGTASDYAWYRFYAACSGQYIRFLMTFDDVLMNTLTTHQQDWVLNAINIWARMGGKIVF